MHPQLCDILGTDYSLVLEINLPYIGWLYLEHRHPSEMKELSLATRTNIFSLQLTRACRAMATIQDRTFSRDYKGLRSQFAVGSPPSVSLDMS
jgi:hypothetical protein